MTEDLMERIANANRRLLRSSAELIETAERMKRDRTQLLDLLRQANVDKQEEVTANER